MGAAGQLLVLQQPLDDVEGRVERGHRRTLHPLAVPAAVGQPVVEEPRRQLPDVGTEPRTVRQGERVDAAVDLAAPVGQVLVLPAAVRRRASAVPRGPRRRAPSRAGRSATRSSPSRAARARPPGTVEVEVRREVRAAGPLPVGVLAASIAAPRPSVATRARVACQTYGGAPTRSRSTCQRSAGSESRSHSTTASLFMARRLRRAEARRHVPVGRAVVGLIDHTEVDGVTSDDRDVLAEHRDGGVQYRLADGA